MNYLLKNAFAYIDGKLIKKNIFLENGYVRFDYSTAEAAAAECLDLSDCVIIPGLTDVHVHLREPGFSYKETIKSGTLAAAASGYTKVFSMPNLKPVPDNFEHLSEQSEIIKRDAKIKVYPYGSISVEEKGEELSALDEMSSYVIAYSDDGRGVQNQELMEQAMNIAREQNKIICAHCEVNSLLKDGYIHDGEYAREHNHKGICSESEYAQILRDIELCKKTKCKYHVCHISTKESVEAIRKAKADGVDITCETGPHYLVLSDKNLQEDGRFKMNPPLRSEEDKKALIQGICDGTIDMIATDHAPHSQEEKSKGLKDSLMGVVGLETAFPIMYTHFVKSGIISLEKLIELMSVNPCKRFGLPCGIKENEKADFCVYDTSAEYTINSKDFISMGHATPFENEKVFSKNIMTVCDGNVVYLDKKGDI